MPTGDNNNDNLPNMRRRNVRTTEMGPPRPRRPPTNPKDKPLSPRMELFKAILLMLSIITAFSIVVYLKRTAHFARKAASFHKSRFDKCQLSTYPAWNIEHLKEINLSECENLELPEEREVWAKFKGLKKMDLNGRSLESLPEAMEALAPSLEILFLSENKFESVPEVIGKLTKLRVLSLRGNNLKELSARNLPGGSLVWLILTNNQIEIIYSNIQELKLLKKLMLSHNSLSNLPIELGKCKDLELIRLADNHLKTIPNEVLTLPKLGWISLSGNPIAISPEITKKIINEDEVTVIMAAALGHGASGTVYRGEYKENDVAVKIFKGGSKGSDGNAEDEIAINGLIDYPLAMSAIGVIPPNQSPHMMSGGMVMELLKGTYSMGKVPSFDTVTRDEGPEEKANNLTEEQVFSVIWNVASALDYIHSSSVGVSHSDVYLHNILRDGKGVARLSDWGASFVYNRSENPDFATSVEKIEVLAFGRLVQDLYKWHFKVAVPDSTESESFLGRHRLGRMEEGPMKELMVSILQRSQSWRPTFREIKETLSKMPEFEKAIDLVNEGVLAQ